MADAYWRYAAADPRQQQQQQQQQHPSAAAGAGAHPGMGGAPQMAAAAGGQQPMKRPRPADFSGSHVRSPACLCPPHALPRDLIRASPSASPAGRPPSPFDLFLVEAGAGPLGL